MKKQVRLFRFVEASGRLGWGSELLAIVLLGVSIVEHFRDKNLPAYCLVLLAGFFFMVGAYRAWGNEHDSFTAEVEKNTKPSLVIEVAGAFFDVSRVPNRNKLNAHIYAYLKVTNLNAPETPISEGTLVMSVDGNRFKGLGDDVTVVGNALEHVSPFKLGGEVSTEIFGNTLSRFPRLLSAVTPEAPLRRGITREGFFVFTFTDLTDWNHENPYEMPVTDFVVTLRDSFGETHVVYIGSLKIPHGSLTTSGALQPKRSS